MCSKLFACCLHCPFPVGRCGCCCKLLPAEHAASAGCSGGGGGGVATCDPDPCVCIYICIHTYTHTYTYMHREREGHMQTSHIARSALISIMFVGSMHIHSMYKPSLHRGQATRNEENGCNTDQFRQSSGRAANSEEEALDRAPTLLVLGCVICKLPITSKSLKNPSAAVPVSCSLHGAQQNGNPCPKMKRGNSVPCKHKHSCLHIVIYF